MSTFDIGDAVALQHKVYSGGALSAATVTITVTAPDGTTSTPSVTSSGTGIYNASVTASAAGIWSYAWDVSGAVPDDVVYGQFTVVTRTALAYVSLSTLKLALGIASDTTRDELLVSAINSASRYIDKVAGRRFYADVTTSARVYRPRGRVIRDDDGDRLLVDDIASATGLTVEIGSGSTYSTVDATTYETGPDNALADGEPIEWLLATNGWWGRSSAGRVRVTARWGWPSVPDDVSEAARIQAARLFRRKDSPEGVTGSADWGAIRLTRIDPDVEALIRPYVRPGFGG